MSTSSKTPFIGIGTGRCGTTSLSRIVNACRRCHCSHESYQLRWYEVTEHLGEMIKNFRGLQKDGFLAGDVSSANGPHVENLRSSISGLKVVCLHRDKESTVESFMDYGLRCIRPGDKKGWVDKCMDGIDKRACASKCFPLIDAASPRQAFGFYWEFYEEIMSKVAEPVLHVRMEDLNDDSTLTRLFDFLDICETDRVYIKKRRFWTREEAQAIRAEMNRGRV